MSLSFLMKTLLIIGCGQLGSRHLQSLALLNEDLHIQIIDPLKESLERAHEIFKTSKKNNFNQSVYSAINLEQVSIRDFDCIIVATSSDVRMEILRVLNRLKFNYKLLILEKVLFDRLSDYQEVETFVEMNKTVVNCPRRIYPYSGFIKNELVSNTPLNMKMSGTDWGLACNSIHFIDLINFFTGEYPLTVITDGLEKSIFPSKRKNFVEFYGILKVIFNKGSILELRCSKKLIDNEFLITQGSKTYSINDKTARMTINKDNQSHTVEARTPFQSELTSIVLNHFFKTGICNLTPLETSLKCHQPLIHSLLDFYNLTQNTNQNFISIT
jgi:hypothetical protein